MGDAAGAGIKNGALGSARETGAFLDVAMALGYVEGVDPALRDKLDHVQATLVNNVR